MAATVRASTAPTATLGPSSPASTAVGDLVLVFTWTRGGAGVPTHTCQTGTGFVEIRTHSHDDGSTDGRLSVAYKIATSAGANAYSAYTSSGGAGTNYSGIVVLQVGTWENALIGDINDSATLTTNGLPNPPAVNAPQAQCLILVIGAWHIASATVAITAPTNYTEIFETAGAADYELSVAQRTLSAAGAEDPGTFTDDVAPNGSVAMTIAFRPRGVVLAATVGTFAETGVSATLPATRRLSTDVATFAAAGPATNLARGLRTLATAAAFAIAGVDAGLTYAPSTGSALTTDVGAFDLTGGDAGLTAQRRLAVSAGALAESNGLAGLTAARRLPTSCGPFVLAGGSVSLSVGRSFSTSVGSFSLAGSSAATSITRRVSTAAGAVSLSGATASLSAQRRLAVALGPFALSERSVSFATGKGAVLSVGGFSCTGNVASLVVARRIAPSAGSFVTTGSSASLLRDYRVPCSRGTLSQVGADATFTIGSAGSGVSVSIECGSIALVCPDAILRVRRGVVATDTPRSRVSVDDEDVIRRR